jgi:ubiquinone/menaquinone biosynthesis C-methylase UbiE
MLGERGYSMDIYDPIFAPDEGVFDRSYDFVTCTEVVEHFAEPRREFDRLDRLVRPGGRVAIMTEVLAPGRDFETWRYARDPTHLCFYRSASIEWVAAHFGWSLEVPHPNVAIYLKAR